MVLRHNDGEPGGSSPGGGFHSRRVKGGDGASVMGTSTTPTGTDDYLPQKMLDDQKAWATSEQQETLNNFAGKTGEFGKARDISALIRNAEEIHADLENSGHFLASTARAEAKKYASYLKRPLDILKKLHNNAPGALQEAIRAYDLAQNTSLQQAKASVELKLHEEMKKITPGFLKRIKADVQASIARNATAVEEEGNFISRMISKTFGGHQNWIKSQSEGGKAAISIGYIGVGSALMAIGEGMTKAAAAGYVEKQASGANEKGQQVTTFIQVPLTSGTRMAKGTVGGTFVLGGALLNGLGFYNLFFSH